VIEAHRRTLADRLLGDSDPLASVRLLEQLGLLPASLFEFSDATPSPSAGL
jgi:hypothetical protein